MHPGHSPLSQVSILSTTRITRLPIHSALLNTGCYSAPPTATSMRRKLSHDAPHTTATATERNVCMRPALSPRNLNEGQPQGRQSATLSQPPPVSTTATTLPQLTLSVQHCCYSPRGPLCREPLEPERRATIGRRPVARGIQHRLQCVNWLGTAARLGWVGWAGASVGYSSEVGLGWLGWLVGLVHWLGTAVRLKLTGVEGTRRGSMKRELHWLRAAYKRRNE